ncbi:MAG: HAD family hydrolase [Bradyrhizobium sp.]|nr:HAD family hydrolase [Bradyrhizobium sp.]
MSISYYENELDRLATTYSAAFEADVTGVKSAIAGASQSSLIAIGSGGSFTVATVLCNLHETYTGQVSRPSTPLEIICNPTLAAASPVFLISAEGKNPDIIEALERARRHSSREIHILTNRAESALTECAARLNDISTHSFELAEKDGYLATNSLLLDAVLVARAYGELDRQPDHIPSSLKELVIERCPISDWLAAAHDFVEKAVARKGLIILYSPLLRPIAADLESKLSEGALLTCQLADFRSFAHGRHLWLAERPEDCAILALTEPLLEGVWTDMLSRFPADIPTLTMRLNGARPRDMLTGLVAEMQLIAKIARLCNRDVGRPSVPKFGRDMYYTNLSSLPPAIESSIRRGERSKREILGAKWPSVEPIGMLSRSLDTFEAEIQRQNFRSVVFDYDGTLCNSQPLDSPPPSTIIASITHLLMAGVQIGVASGRGGSLQTNLQRCISEDLWSSVKIGLYNCGWIGSLGEQVPEQNQTVEFLSHVTRIVQRLKGFGVPIGNIRTTHPYQVSIRFKDGVHAADMWLVIADALRQAGLDTSSVVRSNHSVDVLAKGVSKSHLIADMVQTLKLDPYEILTMGDQGAWPGNDSSLLEHRFSLSVDRPARRLDRGWNLAPELKRGVDATLWYLEKFKVSDVGSFRLKMPPTETMPL